MVPRLARDHQESVFVEGMSSSNRILLNKGLKPGMLPSLGSKQGRGGPGIPNIDPSMRLL